MNIQLLRTKVFIRIFGHEKYERENFRQKTGKILDLNNPTRWGEKLIWLNHNWLPQVKSDCADKYKVREYLTERGFGDLLVPLLGVWEDARDIDFEKLPDRFVLKCNHGCKMNILVQDKSKLDLASVVIRLNKWKSIDYGKESYELHYSNIKPLVICEEFLPVKDESEIVDFKIHCFNGVPKFIGLCFDRDPITRISKGAIYSPEWDRMNLLKENNESVTFPRPDNLSEMLEIAKQLSNDFPYVRVDLYSIKNKIYFGELTFSPDGNLPEREYTEKASKEIGSWLDISYLMK